MFCVSVMRAVWRREPPHSTHHPEISWS